MHWRLRTTTKRDAVEGWFSISIDSAPSSLMPRPSLSELGPGSGANSSSLTPALGSQPVLRFCGLKGFGDELYEMVGHQSLLGIRPGQEHGEALAFIDRGSSAATIFRRLTGQEPGQMTAVHGTAGASGLCVALEQTLSFGSKSSGGAACKPASKPLSSGASTRGVASGSAWGAWGAGARAKVEAPGAASQLETSASAVPATTAAPARAKAVAQEAAERPKQAAEAEPVLDSWEDM